MREIVPQDAVFAGTLNEIPDLEIEPVFKKSHLYLFCSVFLCYRLPEIKFHCVIGRRYTKEYYLRPAAL